jgi:hypothetical protein
VLRAAPTSTIRSLLADLRQQFQLPRHGGYFMYRGKPLRPTLTLADYGVPNRATVVIFFPLCGGADSPPAGEIEHGTCDLYPDPTWHEQQCSPTTRAHTRTGDWGEVTGI